MAISDMMEKIKKFFNGNNTAEDDDAPLPPVKDRHLQHLEREMEYYDNEKRKELLKRKLLALKKKQVTERVFGIGQYKENSKENILKAKLDDSGIDITKEKYNLLKQKNLMKTKEIFK